MSTTSPPADTTRPAKAPETVPPPARFGTTTLVLAAFAAVYLLWGSTYLAMRVGIETIPPLMLAGLRHFTVGVLFYPFLRWETGARPAAPRRKTGALAGGRALCAGD